jgi:hypothetical protein
MESSKRIEIRQIRLRSLLTFSRIPLKTPTTRDYVWNCRYIFIWNPNRFKKLIRYINYTK